MAFDWLARLYYQAIKRQVETYLLTNMALKMEIRLAMKTTKCLGVGFFNMNVYSITHH